MISRVRCAMHKDCFANIDGRCICLTDNNFKNKDCPFYKNKGKSDAEQSRIIRHLIDIGRADLAEEYNGRVTYA